MLKDNITEAATHIDKYAVQQFELKKTKRIRPLA